MTCEYAACKAVAYEVVDGWHFCRVHAAAHRALSGAKPLTPQADPQISRPTLKPCEQRVAPIGSAYDLPVVNLAHARSNVAGTLRPCRSLRPLLAVLNRDKQETAA
jgi:hypothetical protein